MSDAGSIGESSSKRWQWPAFLEHLGDRDGGDPAEGGSPSISSPSLQNQQHHVPREGYALTACVGAGAGVDGRECSRAQEPNRAAVTSASEKADDGEHVVPTRSASIPGQAEEKGRDRSPRPGDKTKLREAIPKIQTVSVEEEQQKPKPSPTPSFRLRDVTNAFEDTPDSDQDLDASLHSLAPSIRTSLPRAVRKGRWPEIQTILNRSPVKKDVREVLMAKHVEGGCGLLMLAAGEGRSDVLTQLAGEIQEQLGTALLVKQLREEDEEQKPLLFYAVASDSKETFVATHKLLRKTVGSGGLEQQLQHKDAQDRNILMHAARGAEDGVWTEVWKMLEKKRDWLWEQLTAEDKVGRTVFLHAAEAGNAGLVQQLIDLDEGLERVTDNNGWTAFMHAARGTHNEKVFQALCNVYESDKDVLAAELAKIGDDGTSLLTHATLGGHSSFTTVRKLLSSGSGYVNHPEKEDERVLVEAKLLSSAAEGGGIKVLNKVADGIKANKFEEGIADATWFDLGTGSWYDAKDSVPGAAERLKAAVVECSKTRGGSLFMSAIESGKQDMLRVVVKGIKSLAETPEECWCMLCGFPGEHEGNPLALAASKSVPLLNETLKALEGECSSPDIDGSPKMQETLMPTDVGKDTPLYGAVCSNDTVLFDEVLAAVKKHFPDEPPSGRQIIKQVGEAMNADQDNNDKQWISAIMLPKVLQAAREADRFGGKPYNISLLDGAVKTAVSRDAFDHLRTLVKSGCHITKQFPDLLSKIGDTERQTSEFICLSITAARNPFVVSSVALHDIRGSDVKYPMNHAALRRLQDKVVALILELLEHLPHSVYDIGNELARGDTELKEYVGGIGKVDPRELLGFIVVRWMLERSAGPSSSGDGWQYGMRIPLLVHTVASATDFLDLLSAPLVVDYLRLEFSRTLPSVRACDPFQRNINQVFYSYTYQDRDDDGMKPDVWQRLLQLLQGWRIKGVTTFPHRTVLPGLQFILAGVMGKPGAFYPVPAVRMYFGVLCYIGMMGLYLSSVMIEDESIPAQEWIFYLVMAGIICREALEFANAKKSLQGPPSVERYFSDAWNFLDVATIVIVVVAFFLRINEALPLAQLFLAMSAPLLFSRVLFLSQMGTALGPMTQVIFTMVTELATFSVVLLLVMLGFATCFTALYGTNSILIQDYQDTIDGRLSCDPEDHPINDAFGDFGDSLQTLFGAMLGDFNFDVFVESYINEAEDDCGGVPYREAGVTLLVLYLIIMAVMLLNLLIAVLSTAHSKVYQHADKQFHAARAKLILQSREDVLHDVLPPPFSLIKPMLGLAWPVRYASEDLWEITVRTVHRFIFTLVVGLTAVAMSTLLWILSLPWVAWSLAGVIGNRFNRDSQSPSTSPPVMPVEDELSPNDSSFAGLEGSHGVTQESLERVFYLSSDRERLTWANMFTFLGGLCCVTLGIVAAAVLCFVVYPLLSMLLWVRGLCSLWEYVKNSREATPWARKQMGLGEEGEEWSLARQHAVKRNESYSSGKASSDDFNVAALLTTTTGMTMEDLRRNLASHRGIRRGREFAAALDEVLSRFPMGHQES